MHRLLQALAANNPDSQDAPLRPHCPPSPPGIPIFLRLFHDSYSFIPGPFNLGRATKPLAAIACAWILLVRGWWGGRMCATALASPCRYVYV